MDFWKNDSTEHFFAILKCKRQNSEMEENETTKMIWIPLKNNGFINRGYCGQTKDCVTIGKFYFI